MAFHAKPSRHITILETEPDSEDLFTFHDKKQMDRKNTNMTTVLTEGSRKTSESPLKYHKCSINCTHDAQKLYDSDENIEEDIKQNISMHNINGSKTSNKDTTVSYHFGSIVTQELENISPAKRIKVMTEILKIIEKFQSQ